MNNELTINALKAENARIKQENSALRDRIKWFERKVFGSMSDKRTEHPAAEAGEGTEEIQMTLFDDEYLKAYEQAKKAAEESAQEIKKEEQERKQKAATLRKSTPARSKKPRYENLERRETIIDPQDINLEEYICIGEDVKEVLHREPAKFWIEVVRRRKYVKRSQQGSDSVKVHQAPAPAGALGNSRVGAEVLAWLIVSKFQWSQPEYRISAMAAQQGVDLPTSTINDWMHLSADRLYLLYLRIKDRILSQSNYLQADEVPFNINDTKGKIRKGYVWQINDCSGLNLGRFFYYKKGSREKAVPIGLFKDYSGAVQVDGYKGYDFLELEPSITLLGCMAHVRRKFTDAEREDPRAKYPLDQIHLLYELERQLVDQQATDQEKAIQRQEKALPILNLLDKWMEYQQSAIMPKSLLGKAISYTYHLMPRLKRYAQDGRYNIDNNACEQGNRTPVIGRKNYLFSANDKYAQDNAIFYTLIETCIDLNVNPQQWLTTVLNQPLQEMTDTELDALLPQYIESKQD